MSRFNSRIKTLESQLKKQLKLAEKLEEQNRDLHSREQALLLSLATLHFSISGVASSRQDAVEATSSERSQSDSGCTLLRAADAGSPLRAASASSSPALGPSAGLNVSGTLHGSNPASSAQGDAEACLKVQQQLLLMQQLLQAAAQEVRYGVLGSCVPAVIRRRWVRWLLRIHKLCYVLRRGS